MMLTKWVLFLIFANNTLLRGCYRKAEELALELGYALIPYVADRRGIDFGQVVLVVISRNNKVVVCSSSRYRNWLYQYFQQPSLGNAQFYDDVAPELILEKLDLLCH